MRRPQTITPIGTEIGSFVFSIITKALKKKDRVGLISFGTFRVAQRKASESRDRGGDQNQGKEGPQVCTWENLEGCCGLISIQVVL